MTRMKGIDVSHWQGLIDWDTLKKSTDISFAIIRVGVGTKKDKYFNSNVAKALAANIYCGVYVYSKATSPEEATEEADFVIKSIKSYNIRFPVYYGIEDSRQLRLTNEERTALITSFCDRISAAHYIPGVYANTNWFNTKFNLNLLKKYEKWIAHLGVTAPSYDGAYGMWQYSSTGKVDGIEGDVDLDYCYINYLAYPQNFKIGTKLILNNVPLYTSSIRKEPSSTINGTYYIYDGIAMNNRFRITELKKNINTLPISEKVTGYVKLSDLFIK